MHVKVEHIRRRIDGTQSTVDGEWCSVDMATEPLRWHNLKDITCLDIVYRTTYHVLKLALRAVRGHL